jgi:hypothetical protein
MLMSGRSYEKDSGTKRPEQTWHQELAGSWTLNVAFFFGGQAFSNLLYGRVYVNFGNGILFGVGFKSEIFFFGF